jgi:hypothetical protein
MTPSGSSSANTSEASPHSTATAAARSTWTSRFITGPITDNELADPHSWAVFICLSFDGRWALWAIRNDDSWTASWVDAHRDILSEGENVWYETGPIIYLSKVYDWEAWNTRDNPDTVSRCSAGAIAVLDRWATDDAFAQYTNEYEYGEDVIPMVVSDGVREVLRHLHAGVHTTQLPSDDPG